jgi:isopentenyl diphosphate isomerase/L-lactate dehydrogenase-like FMN-dependent dehydrogenase
MAAGGYVVVSQKLADTLIADGFRKGGFRRGVDRLTAISAGANLVGIFVARHEIARFVAHLWAAARGRAANREHDSMVAVAHRGRRVAMMTTLLEAMTEFDRDQQGVIPRSSP